MTNELTDDTIAHEVVVTIHDDEARIAFSCSGSRSASCHVYPDAESWHDGDGRERLEHADCWLQGWFDVGPEAAIYDGEDAINPKDESVHPLIPRRGPIEATYEDEYIVWHFADPDKAHRAALAAEKGSN